MIKPILNRLNQPFPSRKNLKNSVIGQFYVALFIAGFLFVFKPFGMRNAPDPFLLSLAFGLVSFLFSLSFDLFCRYILRIKTDVPSWTFWKWLLQCVLMVSWIAFGNYLLQAVLFWEHLNELSPWDYIKLWFEVWKATIALGCFPIFASGLIAQMRAIDINNEQAQQIQLPEKALEENSSQAVEFSINANESVLVATQNLKYVEAMQNYVSIYVLEHGILVRHMVRNTIANTLKTFSESGADQIVRCHRSFLVNIDAIDSISGNAQGLRLELDVPDQTPIPVSRSYLTEFKRALDRE